MEKLKRLEQAVKDQLAAEHCNETPEDLEWLYENLTVAKLLSMLSYMDWE